MASGKLSRSAAQPTATTKKSGHTHNSARSAEYVEDSSEEQPESEDGTAASPSSTLRSSTAGGPPPVKNVQTEQDEASESEDERDEKPTNSTAAEQRHQEIDMTGSGNESTSEQDSSSEDKESEADGATNGAEKLSSGGATRSGGTNKIKFRPPQGFLSVTIPQDYSMRHLVTPENLAGKQLWHIVAPSHLPMSSITSATMIRAQTGDSLPDRFDGEQIVVSQNGLDYSFVEDTGEGSPRWVYAPNANQSTFAPTAIQISRELRLQQISQPNSGDEPSTSAGVDTQGPGRTRPIPQQPPGLKMRYHPFGIATEDHLSRDVPSSRPDRPLSPTQLQSPEKRKALRNADSETPEKLPKKRHKHKRDKKAVQEPYVNGHDHTDTNMEFAMDTPVTGENEVEMNAEPENEAPEERAKRRAERKRRREEKLARKAAKHAKRETAGSF